MQEFALARLAPITDGAPRPFWSVVIPTYQRPEMLRQCLDSVLAQAPGPEHMEIIVHEDHGQETAAAVIASCGRGRVRHVRAAAKLHSVPNINAALRSSRGLWTHLLHDDDWVEPGFHEHFRGVLEGQPDGVGACICGLINRPQGRPPDRLRMLQDHAGVMGRFSRSILLANPISPPALVVRREAYERLGLLREDRPLTADWEFLIRLTAAFEVFYLPRHLANYRLHGASLTGDNRRDGSIAREVKTLLDEQERSGRFSSEDIARARANQATLRLKSARVSASRDDAYAAINHVRAALTFDAGIATQQAILDLIATPAGKPVRRWVFDTLVRQAGGPAPPEAPSSAAPAAQDDPSRQPPQGDPPPIARCAITARRPFWTVAIPAFRRFDLLRQALRSVLAEDPGPEHLEVIVSQDHWHESAAPVVEEFGAGRIRLHLAEHRLGLSGNWNNCVNLATGRWVHLLHDDDWVAPEFHAVLRASLEKLGEDVGAAACATIHVYGEDKHYRGKLLRPESGLVPEIARELIRANPFSPPAVVIRREAYEAVGGYRPDFPYTTDWELLVRIPPRFGWWYEARHLAYYRRHLGALTLELIGTGAGLRDGRRLIELHAPRLNLPAEIVAGARTNQARLYIQAARKMLLDDDLPHALNNIREVLATSTAPIVIKEVRALADEPAALACRVAIAEAIRAATEPAR